ncbi:asparaginase [Yunchengibacter salinarum]|uniref:asparaginase n=1 Tax=Yunchengibacter salinarum TaxID=3133399 RepID=UPI0035B5FD14
MANKPVIDVLALGGTIAMVPGKDGGVSPGLSASDLVQAAPAVGQMAAVRATSLAGVGSANLTLDHVRDVLAHAARSDADAVIVTQGTDTLEETSFLASLAHDGSRPIVFTGAMRPPRAPGADGPANLADSAATALHLARAGSGAVVLVMDNAVHDPARVVKAHTSRLDAFTADGGPLGQVVEGGCYLAALPVPALRLDLSDCAPARVARLSVGLDDGDAGLMALDPARLDGLVVDAFGAGHVSEATADRLVELAARLPVVLASRTGFGRVLEGTYGYRGAEMDLIARGLIPSGGLGGARARLALSVLLGGARVVEGPNNGQGDGAAWRAALDRLAGRDRAVTA